MSTEYRKITSASDLSVEQVSLTNQNNRDLGLVSVETALQLAQEAGLDLVLTDEAKSLCQLMDYGKYKFACQKNKKHSGKQKRNGEKEAKQVELDESSSETEIDRQVRQIVTWSKEGLTVKLTVHFGKPRNQDKAQAVVDRVLSNRALGKVANTEVKATVNSHTLEVEIVSAN